MIRAWLRRHLAPTALLAALGGAPACTGPNPAFMADDGALDSAPTDTTPRPEPRTSDAGSGIDAAADETDALPVRPPDALTSIDAPVVDAVTTGTDTVDMRAVDASSPDASLPLLRNYTFETGVEGWADLRYTFYKVAELPVSISTTHAFEGTHGLRLALKTTSTYTMPTFGIAQVFATLLPGGTVITFHVWLPTGTAIQGVQPYVLYFKKNGGADPFWDGQVHTPPELVPGQWNTFTERVPTDIDLAAGGVAEVGVEWRVNGAQTVTVYVDGVSW